MKKVLKIVLYSFLASIFIVIILFHMSYNSFSPDDEGVGYNEANLIYFQYSYEDCRKAFLAESHPFTVTFDGVELFSINVPSQADPDLYIDFIYIPPLENTGKLLVISSGIHVAEGFAGSAVTQMFLNELLTPDVLSETGVLLIHSINPYGFKFHRRVTENNIDLNRGSGIDSKLFNSKNPGYEALYSMVNPSGEASAGSLRNRFFHLISLWNMTKMSMGEMRQSIAQGQYDYPEGLFFGGMEFGDRRKLHLFHMPVEDSLIKKKTESIFQDQHIDWGDSDNFYTVSGAFAVDFLSKITPDATYLYMIFEWGTMNSLTPLGSMKTLKYMINENQGEQYGYKSNTGAEN